VVGINPGCEQCYHYISHETNSFDSRPKQHESGR
jgi:hypothetical protein